MRMLKGALNKFNIIPQVFPKKVGIFIPLEVFTKKILFFDSNLPTDLHHPDQSIDRSIHIELWTHFLRPIQNVILLWYYTMFTWIKISRACQIDMERREKKQTFLKDFFTNFFVLSFKSWFNLLKTTMLA